MTQHFNEQQSLLHLPPVARTTDPETSKEAAEVVTTSGQRRSQINAAVRLVRRHPGLTGNELAAYGILTERQLSRRLSDAHDAKLIEPGEARKCSVSGARARTWFPVAQKVAA